MYFGAPSRFRKSWGISLKTCRAIRPTFRSIRKQKVNKQFKIQCQLQYLTTRPNDMIHTLVCNVITVVQLQFTVYHKNLTRAAWHVVWPLYHQVLQPQKSPKDQWSLNPTASLALAHCGMTGTKISDQFGLVLHLKCFPVQLL